MLQKRRKIWPSKISCWTRLGRKRDYVESVTANLSTTKQNRQTDKQTNKQKKNKIKVGDSVDSHSDSQLPNFPVEVNEAQLLNNVVEQLGWQERLGKEELVRKDEEHRTPTCSK